MTEERKPLVQFSAVRTANGGWVVSEATDERFIATRYAYSSDRDMLDALPGLIGAKDNDGRERGRRYWHLAQEAKRLSDGYENGD